MDTRPFKNHKPNEISEQEQDDQGPKIDLFDLPNEVLLPIFDTGTRLKAAELVCKNWHAKIRSCPDFWQLACKRILIDEEMIKRNMSEVLNVDPKFILVEPGSAEKWRRIWVKHGGGACEGCYGLGYCDYKAYNRSLCENCRFREPYRSWDKVKAASKFS